MASFLSLVDARIAAPGGNGRAAAGPLALPGMAAAAPLLRGDGAASGLRDRGAGSAAATGVAATAADRHAHYVLLDAERGLAAIAVLIVHLGNESGVHLIQHGFLAVDFFLMLSGFVIARAYEGKLASGALSLPGFLAVRAARLWPVIVAAGLLASASIWAWPVPDWAPGPWLLWQFALIPSALWLLFPANAPLWSLFYETIANVSHGALLRRLPTRWLAPLAGALAAGAIGYAAATGVYDVGFRPGEVGPALLRIFGGYLAGMLLWRLFAAGRIAAPALHWSVPALLILGPMLLPHAVPDGIAVAIALPCFAAAIMTSLSRQPQGRARGLATWLGGISYPLYAVHMPMMKLGFALWQPGAPAWLRLAGWVALGVAALIAASLIERYYDAPVRAWLRARIGAVRPSGPARSAPAR